MNKDLEALETTIKMTKKDQLKKVSSASETIRKCFMECITSALEEDDVGRPDTKEFVKKSLNEAKFFYKSCSDFDRDYKEKVLSVYPDLEDLFYS